MTLVWVGFCPKQVSCIRKSMLSASGDSEGWQQQRERSLRRWVAAAAAATSACGVIMINGCHLPGAMVPRHSPALQPTNLLFKQPTKGRACVAIVAGPYAPEQAAFAQRVADASTAVDHRRGGSDCDGRGSRA